MVGFGALCLVSRDVIEFYSDSMLYNMYSSYESFSLMKLGGVFFDSSNNIDSKVGPEQLLA